MPSPRVRSKQPPALLRRSDAVIGKERYVILSYPVATNAPVPGLTVAESAVLSLAVSGLTNAEIAASRGVSTATIQNQLARAFRKLGVGSRAEALSWLISRGLGPAKSSLD